MAFVVEDGTGLIDATSYVDVAFADSYFQDRGNSVWAGLTEARKESCLIEASSYIDIRFQYSGSKLNFDQGLAYPRANSCCASCDGMPAKLLKACCEYAIRANSGPLAPDPEVDPSGFAVRMKRDKLGPLEEQREYQVNDYGDPWETKFRPYPAADSLIEPCSDTMGSNVKFLIRA